jgi:hypothetical protein
VPTNASKVIARMRVAALITAPQCSRAMIARGSDE